MNRQEALLFLDKCRQWFEPYTGDSEKWHEALDMAMEALQFQDIMINSSKTVKLTPEVCDICMDNKQDDWIPIEYLSIEDTGTMIRLKDLQGYNYYLTEANMPPGYQRGAELADIVEFIQGSGKDWVICYTDQSLRDKVVIRADQIYRAEEVSDQNRRVSK